MATLKTIRKRIRSVKNTQQITKAMKMVAAAKLRRAQEALVKARPYADRIEAVMSHVAARCDSGRHPLLRQPTKLRRVGVFVMTSDRGLCGGFNSNLLRAADRFVVDHQTEYEVMQISAIGRKAIEYFRSKGVTMQRQHMGVFEKVSVEFARQIAASIMQEYTAKELDAVFLIYNSFKSVISQVITTKQLLPVPMADLPKAERNIDHLYEPGPDELLDALTPAYLEMTIFRAMLESAASEQGARMSAMDAATKNAKEMIRTLTLTYNRARQAAITKELVEIVSGAEALKG